MLQRYPLEQIVRQISQKEPSFSDCPGEPLARRSAYLVTKDAISSSFSRLIAFPRNFCWYKLTAGWLTPSSFAASAWLRLRSLTSSFATIAAQLEEQSLLPFHRVKALKLRQLLICMVSVFIFYYNCNFRIVFSN